MKVSYAKRSLFRDKTRFIISLLGVSFSIILILVLLGIYQGFISSSKRFILTSGANIWVAQAGVKDLHALSYIPVTLKNTIEEIDGVKQVGELTIRRVVINVKGDDFNIDIVGFDQVNGLGGPSTAIKGKTDPGEREIVIDRQIAINYQLDLGDKLEVEKAPFKIVGITRGQTTGIISYAFIDLAESKQIYNNHETVNYILVKSEKGSVQKVKSEIDDLPANISTFKTPRFADNTAEFITTTFGPILAAIVGIALVIGTSIVGLITYTITLAKQREYGLLKAIGAPNRWLYGTVFQQSLISGLIGFIFGSLLSFGVSALLEEFIVEINVEQLNDHFALVFIVAITMSIVASYIPAKKVTTVDPAAIFNG